MLAASRFLFTGGLLASSLRGHSRIFFSGMANLPGAGNFAGRRYRASVVAAAQEACLPCGGVPESYLVLYPRAVGHLFSLGFFH